MSCTRLAASILFCVSATLFFNRRSSSIPSFSFSWRIISGFNCSLTSCSSSFTFSNRALLASSFSFSIAVCSISSCSCLRSSRSISSGWLSSCTRMFAHASSTRSIALSGRNRSWMYRCDNFAAKTSAESSMRTP